MADDLDDGEFWVPPAFLSDEASLLKKKLGSDDAYCKTDLMQNRFRSFWPCLDLGSPVESVMGSTETESDEEDFMAGLTMRMGHSTLLDDFSTSRSGFGSESPKPKVLATSPQSTLCDLGTRYGSSDGSSNGPSRGSSPPPATWDLLYAAAGEVARMSLSEGPKYYDRRSLFNLPQKPNSVNNPNSSCAGFYHEQSLNHNLNFEANQFKQLIQIEVMKQQRQKGTVHYHYPQLLQNRARNSEFVTRRSCKPFGLSPAAWPLQLQQENGSGMKAVFLDSAGTKRASVGTGVFLPRRAGTPCETRKKRARVVQALNLNLEEMGDQTQLQPRSNISLGTVSDVSLNLRNDSDHPAQVKRHSRPQPVANREIRLPQEWTY